MLGFKPYVTMDRRDELGRPDGTDMRLLRMLEDKMGFTAEINFITSFRGVVEEVTTRRLLLMTTDCRLTLIDTYERISEIESFDFKH